MGLTNGCLLNSLIANATPSNKAAMYGGRGALFLSNAHNTHNISQLWCDVVGDSDYGRGPLHRCQSPSGRPCRLARQTLAGPRYLC